MLAAGTTIGDTTISLYCNPFDQTDATANLVAYDDDSNGLLSAFIATDGITLTPGNVYWFVLATFGNGATGDYTIEFSTNVVLAEHAPMVNVNAVTQPNSDVNVYWATSAEYGVDHFNVWRSDAPDGTFAMVNGSPIAATGAGEYTYTDTPGAGTWYYIVEAISIHGMSELHGPVAAGLPTDVSLTGFGGDSAGGSLLPAAALLLLAVAGMGALIVRRKSVA